MFSDSEKYKMEDFIKVQMLNPVLFYDNPSDMEENIALFYYQNEKKILNLFAGKEYFPGHSKDEIETVFFQALEHETIKKLKERIRKLIFTQLDISCIQKISTPHFELETVQDMIYVCLDKFIVNNKTRRALSSVMRLINFRIIDRYIAELYAANSPLISESELYKKYEFSEKQVAEYIKLVLLLSVINTTMNSAEKTGMKTILTGGDTTSECSAVNDKTLTTLCNEYSNKLKYISSGVLRDAFLIHSRLEDGGVASPISKLCRILYIFGKYYKHNVKKDPGAEPFEKSFLTLLNKNSKYYNVDNMIIEELYKIASRNNW